MGLYYLVILLGHTTDNSSTYITIELLNKKKYWTMSIGHSTGHRSTYSSTSIHRTSTHTVLCSHRTRC